MLVTPSSSPLLIAGQKIITPGRFVDDFQRGSSFDLSPLGMGWQDLGELLPQTYDLSRIHNGAVGSGDPYWRGKNGATMAPDNDWANYASYPGMAVGGLGGAIRNVGDGIYNYDVTCRVGGFVGGLGGVEAEGTPIVGVNPATEKLGYGCWIVNLAASTDPPIFVLFVGYVGNPPEEFLITHVAPVSHTLGQARDVTLKYRETGYTVWIDGAQITNLTTYPAGVPIGSSLITVPVEHQNRSWAGFEYDQHITAPDQMSSNPSILSYSHQAIS